MNDLSVRGAEGGSEGSETRGRESGKGYCSKMGLRHDGLNQDSSYRNGEIGSNAREMEKAKLMGGLAD